MFGGADANVRYGISEVGAKNVIAAFRGIDTNMKITSHTMKTKLVPNTRISNMGLMNMGRIAQDMPFGLMGISNNLTFMAEQMGRAKEQGFSFRQQLKGMARQMMGVGGLTFAFSVLTSALLIWQMNSGKAEDKVKGFTEQLKKMWSATFKLSEEWRKFNKEVAKFNTAQVEESVLSLKKALDDIGPSFLEGGLMAFGYTGFIKGAKEETIKFRQMLEALMGIGSAAQEESNRLANIREQLIGKTTKEIKELVLAERLNKTEIDAINKALSEQLKMFPVLSTGYNQIKTTMQGLTDIFKIAREEVEKIVTALSKVAGASHMFAGVGSEERGGAVGGGAKSFGGATLFSPRKGGAQSALIKDANKVGKTVFDNWSTILVSNMITAWATIFGEANSLFEQLINSMADLLVKGVFSELLSFIPGGGIIGSIGNLFSGSASPPNQKIVVQIGDVEMEEIYLRGQQVSRRRGNF